MAVESDKAIGGLAHGLGFTGCHFLHSEAALVQPTGFQPHNTVNAGKAIGICQISRVKGRVGMNAGQFHSQRHSIIAHRRKARRRAAINALITLREADPIGAHRRRIPAAMQRRLLAQTDIIPQAGADKFHPPRVNIIIGQQRGQIAQRQTALGQKHRIIGNIPQRLSQLQRLISRGQFRRAVRNGAKQGIGFAILGHIGGGQRARGLCQPRHFGLMRGRAAVKLRQSLHRLKHLLGLGRIGFNLHHCAAKARHFSDKALTNALAIRALRQQRAETRQPLRYRLGNDLGDVLLGQKTHQPNM